MSDATKRLFMGGLRALLLLLAVLVSFGGCFWARDWVAPLPSWGGPFSYWLAAQGAVLVFIGVVAIYAAVMNRMDAERERDSADELAEGPHV